MGFNQLKRHTFDSQRFFQLVKFHPNALGDVPDRNGGEEANAFFQQGQRLHRACRSPDDFPGPVFTGAAMKPSSCSCARAFRMVPLPAASALLSSRSPGMAFMNCPDRRRCFNLATVLDWAVSPGCVSMGESYFLVTSDGKRSCRLCFFRSAFFGSMEEYDVQERFRRRLTESGSLGSKTVSPAPVSFLILG